MPRLALRELYIEELRDLYDAESRMIKALPKLAEAAESEKLRDGFRDHLRQTRSHLARLEEVFEKMGEEPGGSEMGAIPDDDDSMDYVMGEEFENGVKDAALISAAQRVEHYEIAAYGCVRTWAGLLGDKDAQALLDKTLREEKQAEEKLTELSETINLELNSEPSRTEIASAANH
jgi:ferritin-like metal-binding protein YciE